MNIDPSSHLEGLQRAAQAKPRPVRPTPAGADRPGEDAPAVRHRMLVKEVMDMPEVRPDVVERGRRLIADPAYPSAVQLEALAARLASVGAEL